MAGETLWSDVQLQAFYALLAVAGATFLPGRTLAERLALGRGRLGGGRVALALLGFLALSHALHAAVVWLGLLEGTALAEIDETVREASPLRPWLVWVAFALAPGLGEELLFRGFLLRLLAWRLPAALAVLGSAGLFGAAHLDLVQGGAAFLLGGYLGALAAKAGSVRPAVLCHAVNNSLAVAGTAGWLPEMGGPSLAPVAAGLALAALCLVAALRPARLQPGAPPADGDAIPRGLHEVDRSGPDRR